MNFGRSDGRYPEEYSSSDPSMGVSVNSNSSSLSPYLSINPAYLHQGGQSEFVFPTDDKKTRTWGEQMFSGIGTSYMTGLMIGGTWGFFEGIRNPDGKTMKLRINSVLNGCTRRGPFMANSLGVLALMYSTLNYGIGKLREKDDQYNSIIAAMTTGIIFKSTAGPRAVGVAGLLGGSLALAYHTGEKILNGNGKNIISSPTAWA